MKRDADAAWKALEQVIWNWKNGGSRANLRAVLADYRAAICAPREDSQEELTEWRTRTNPPCVGCGGPHPFDTSVPSPLWNRVIRDGGLPDYLCTTCIVLAFVKAGESFEAELYGEPVDRADRTVPLIRVQVDGRPLDESYGDLQAALAAPRPEPLDELRALSDAATPGPWPIRHRASDRGVGDDESAGLGWEFGWPWDDPRADEQVGPPEPQLRGVFSRYADAALIVAAVNYVRAALASSEPPS